MNNQADTIDLNRDKTLTSSLNRTMYFFVKRLFDVLMAIIGIIAMIPIALIVKVSYMLTGDFDSIFYKQKRIGKNGEEFNFYKFRSMVPNSKEMLEEMLKDSKYKKEWEKNQKFENDPRITKAGKILRKTSLDEMPQFLNVLKNDMSLIGPRPLIPGELDSHDGDHSIYEAMKPGITGWWASHGRSDTTYEERLKLEYFYVNNCSLSLDIKCIVATVMAVICKKGAK